MSTEFIFIMGLMAGFLQVYGYIIYIKDDNIDPNPVTWFMFAYGTAILTLLEWDSNATLPELILPISCSIFSIYVSYRCWIKARKIDPTRWWPEDWWPEDMWEKWSFVLDIVITLGYILAWVLSLWSILTPEYRELGIILFLTLSNITVFPSFYPLLRETYINPSKENFKPWVIWTVAYVLLAIVTYKTHAQIYSLLMFYPLSNIFLHGLMVWLARPRNNIKIYN